MSVALWVFTRSLPWKLAGQIIIMSIVLQKGNQDPKGGYDLPMQDGSGVPTRFGCNWPGVPSTPSLPPRGIRRSWGDDGRD